MIRAATTALALAAAGALAFELTWTSVDGGGTMWSMGGGYTLGATAGQPDAGGMGGGGFAFEGGFWPGATDEFGWLAPTLRIGFASGLPHVYWPAETSNAQLSVSANLNGPAWNAVTSGPTLVGAEWRVPVGAATGAIYRLERLP